MLDRNERITLDESNENCIFPTCSGCGNYIGNRSWSIGKKVDKMYELRIGGMCSTLCPDCLSRIKTLIESV